MIYLPKLLLPKTFLLLVKESIELCGMASLLVESGIIMADDGTAYKRWQYNIVLHNRK